MSSHLDNADDPHAYCAPTFRLIVERAEKAEAEVNRLQVAIAEVLAHDCTCGQCEAAPISTSTQCTCSTDAINMCPTCRAAKRSTSAKPGE